MEQIANTAYISALLECTRKQIGRTYPCTFELFQIHNELRERRKSFLGSYVSLVDMVQSKGIVEEDHVLELCAYLASRTMHFWNRTDEQSNDFCLLFYELAICSISSGKVGNETIDDLIQLADCLVRSRDIFTVVTKELLSPDMISTLFAFIEMCEDVLLTPEFTDAVLGAVSVFLGVLKDPCTEEAIL